MKKRDPGVKIIKVQTLEGHSLHTRVVDTMMRVDLPRSLLSGGLFQFEIEWGVNVLRHKDTWARSGYEDLKSLDILDQEVQEAEDKLRGKSNKAADKTPTDETPTDETSTDETSTDDTSTDETPTDETPTDETPTDETPTDETPTDELTESEPIRRIYEIAQWYPRLAAYTDVTGWQNKQFLGNGEFTLEFGDFVVRITAPDHLTLTATGELMNPAEVLTADQRSRLGQAAQADQPMWVITPQEARAQSLKRPQSTKTWIFSAQKVRDFAFAASNTFIWDAMGHRRSGSETVMAMSFYPLEAESLWSRYSTHAVLHTLEQYERFAFLYPYPVAISVNGPIFGMEYPMVSFNGVRPEPDGTYSEKSKYALIGVIIHEVGHFFFPMIVNSDERQWTWLDEGINSFLQYQAERAWEEEYPSWNGGPEKMITYMTSGRQRPIMTNSESLLQFGANAYGKPTAALSLLRETIMGPTLFDEAFRAYAERWKFKRPMPSDFFRTLEDVSGVDLDWFWRGWFYSTAHVDIQIKTVRRLRLKTKDPQQDKAVDRLRHERRVLSISVIRDEGRERRVDRYPELKDFYNTYDPYEVTPAELEAARVAEIALSKKYPERVKELQTDAYFYEVTMINKGGLVTPLPLRLELEGHRSELRRIPAEVWRKNHREVKLLLELDSPLLSIEFDPFNETGDAHKGDNRFPQRIRDEVSFELKTWRKPKTPNPMQKDLTWRYKQEKIAAEKSLKTKADSADQTANETPKIEDTTHIEE